MGVSKKGCLLSSHAGSIISRANLALGLTFLLILTYSSSLAKFRPSIQSEVYLTDQTSDLPDNLREEDRFDPIPDWSGRLEIAIAFPSSSDQYAIGTGHLRGENWRGPPGFRPVHNLKPPNKETAVVTCKGPRGKKLDRSRQDRVLRYTDRPPGFAEPLLGSSSLVGFEQDVCYERNGRHAVYGMKDGNESKQDIDWDEVDWWNLQQDCIERNKHRFDMSDRTGLTARPSSRRPAQNGLVPRTAVIFRLHQHSKYTEEAKRNMRAVIQELALYTGGQYQVFLLVEIKDDSLRIWDDSAAYDKLIMDLVPPEFWGMTVLWTESDWYEKYDMISPKFLNVHLGQWYPMQYFRELYPEFDFYWNYEMDVRYTGHYHDLMRSVDEFTTAQPRKGLWERNSRFYIPRLHGSYEQFRDMVQERYMMDGQDTTVWGPFFPPDEPDKTQVDRVRRLNITPPVTDPSMDDFSWGVGEHADLITFLPMFDPEPTNYAFKDAYRNYDPSMVSSDMPRRTTIITFMRLSNRLLQVLEEETSTPPMRHMGSETWPHSLSLHYGLKAVNVPHGIYMANQWPAQALDFVFNNGDQNTTLADNADMYLDPRGEGAGGPASTFGLGREHHWMGSTWYYRNDLAPKLYARWLGWEKDGYGGPDWEERSGRYCLPPMLLHPVKDMEDPR